MKSAAELIHIKVGTFAAMSLSGEIDMRTW